jgi:hypothetical protein
MFKRAKTASGVDGQSMEEAASQRGGKTQRAAEQYQSLVFKNKNSFLIEAMEPGCFLEDTLRMRHNVIPRYSDLGPPDLCYLVVEQQKKPKLLQKKAP